MADHVLRVAIETTLKGEAGELSIRQQRELKKALDDVNRGAELTVRQMRTLEAAAKASGGQAAELFKQISPQSDRGANFVPNAERAQRERELAAAIGQVR